MVGGGSNQQGLRGEQHLGVNRLPLFRRPKHELISPGAKEKAMRNRLDNGKDGFPDSTLSSLTSLPTSATSMGGRRWLRMERRWYGSPNQSLKWNHAFESEDENLLICCPFLMENENTQKKVLREEISKYGKWINSSVFGRTWEVPGASWRAAWGIEALILSSAFVNFLKSIKNIKIKFRFFPESFSRNRNRDTAA